MVFFVIALKTRAVEIAGIRVNPDGEWMKQMARNLTDSVDGFLRNATYLIHDRDPLFTEAFEAILRERGVKCVKIPAQSPNCNPHAERFVKTIRYECLQPFRLLRGTTPAVRGQGVHGALPSGTVPSGAGRAVDREASADEARRSGKVVCRSRLGGMLNFYHREAA